MRPRVGIQFNGIFLVPHPSDARIFELFSAFVLCLGLHLWEEDILPAVLITTTGRWELTKNNRGQEPRRICIGELR